MDFEINDGVLIKYHGNDSIVTIPAGVMNIADCAFYECEGMKNLTIPDGVICIGESAFDGCNNLSSVTIPESVESIGACAFSGCSCLTSVIISDGVKSIGENAFYECSALDNIRLPKYLNKIDTETFSECRNLTSVIIPEGVTEIGKNAFSTCCSLTNVNIPDTVSEIGESAFAGCRSLIEVIIPDSVTYIGESAFNGCDSLKNIVLPESVIETGEGAFGNCPVLDMDLSSNSITKFGKDAFGGELPAKLRCKMAELAPHLTDGDLKYYFLWNVNCAWPFQPDEAKIEVFCSRQGKTLNAGYSGCMTGKDVSVIADALLNKFADSPSAKVFSAAVNLLLMFSKKLTDEQINKIYAAMKGIKSAAKYVQKIEADDYLMKHVVNEEVIAPQLSPEEQLVDDAMSRNSQCRRDIEAELDKLYGLKFKDLPEIKSLDGRTEPEYLVAWLLVIHKDNGQIGLLPKAESVLAYLDPDSLQKALISITDTFLGGKGESKKHKLAFPVCRYANENTMNELLKRAPKWKSSARGKDSPALYAFRRAVIYSEHRAVMLFADKYGDLDEYAFYRGTDAQTIRDTAMSDFGFDEDGSKTYDLGGTKISVHLEKDLSLSLYDCAKGKYVKSIPKKDNDETLVAVAAKDFADLKKNVKKVIKNRFDRLFDDFLSGKAQPADKWQKSYMENPLLRCAANIVVWQQGSDTFIMQDKQAVKSDGSIYVFKDTSVRVAHPMEMKQDTVMAWQRYFIDNGLKQPFEQIWEPVIDPVSIDNDRYKDAAIPYYRFMNAEKHGIYVKDYDFHNEIEISFSGCRAEVERIDWARHSISPDTGFEIKEFGFDTYDRQVNHIVAYLDKATVYDQIIKDDVNVVNLLHNFTQAQIFEFIRVANEHKAINVTALLLDYKNEHFGTEDVMAEFMLEL